MHSEAVPVLKNFANFTGKHLCWRLFWIKLETRRTLKHSLFCLIKLNQFFPHKLKNSFLFKILCIASNTRKLLMFSCFLGVCSRNICQKWVHWRHWLILFHKIGRFLFYKLQIIKYLRRYFCQSYLFYWLLISFFSFFFFQAGFYRLLSEMDEGDIILVGSQIL